MATATTESPKENLKERHSAKTASVGQTFLKDIYIYILGNLRISCACRIFLVACHKGPLRAF